MTSIVPAAVSVDVTMRVTGSGFAATAAANEVTFTPEGGQPVAGAVTAVSAVDAAGSLRRLTVRVPAGLPLGPAAITVRNVSAGLSGGGASVQVVSLQAGTTSLEPGQTRDVDVLLFGQATFDATTNRVTLGAGLTVNRVTVASPTRLVANVTVAPTAAIGPRTLGVLTPVMTASRASALRVDPPPAGGGGPPVAVIDAPARALVGEPVTFDGSRSSDPDNDRLRFSWTFSDGATASGPTVARTFDRTGEFSATLTVSDGSSDATAQHKITIADSAPPTLESLAVTPSSLSFTALGQPRQLTVTGTFSDGSTRDLTAASTGTTYESSAEGVATVAADGLVSAVADGASTITARNGDRQATASVTVSLPPTLVALEISPQRATLRSAGATLTLTLTGLFSDGALRDLTTSPDVVYTSSDAGVATVGATGLVTAVAEGRAAVTAAIAGRSAVSDIDVVFGAGTGFLRGEVFDDRTGLPLSGATVTLLADGNGDLPVPPVVIADARGRFLLPARAGEVLVRIARAGFTTVDRRGTAPSSGLVTLLDARLTPLDARQNPIQSVFGGRARDQADTTTLDVPAGGLPADQTFVLTPLSNQGLGGRLPQGWSPLGMVDIAPELPRLDQPATLRLPNAAALPAGASLVLAHYDRTRRAWIALDPAAVSADGLAIVATVARTGQFVALVADEAPVAPPAPVTGEPLTGVTAPPLPTDLTAEGVVVPRAPPPGEDARAVGRLSLGSASAMSSGVVVRALVSERFDLLDQSRVVPLPFTQDLVLYQRPRLADQARIGTRFPITPSLPFTIQQLASGVVTLDVLAGEADAAGGVAGAGGGSLTADGGLVLDVPAGALAADTFVGLARTDVAQLGLVLPPSLEAIAAAEIELIGVAFAAPASLSIPRPGTLDPGAQVWLGQLFVDPFGVRRLRLVARVEVQPTRLVSRHLVNGATLPGVATAGTYVFLRSTETLGLVTGLVRLPGGAVPQAGVLLTSDTAAFADVTSAAGRFAIAGRAGGDTQVTARDAATGDGATVTVALPASAVPVEVAITLGIVAPTVISTSPTANATDVPLDATVQVTFSEPIDPSSVTADAFSVRVGTVEVAGTRVVSADRLRVTFRPDGALAGNATHTVSLSGAIRDLGGNGLAGFTPFGFRTIDPSRPPQPPPGQLTADLPDEDGFVIVTGSAGTAENGAPVTVTNPRTQETFTVLALADGSFRARLVAALGDRLVVTFRNASGAESTFTFLQFTGPDGTTGIGRDGGTVTSQGRVARVRPRALTAPGTFRLLDADLTAFPAETADFGYVDRFALAVTGARFATLRSLSLSESQNRFAPAPVADEPFAAAASLVVPGDFLAGASLRFTAVAIDATGARATAEGATTVVGSDPQGDRVEVATDAEFPAVYLDVPRQAQPNLQIAVGAVAPAARVDFEVPMAGADATRTFLLVGPLTLGADTRLQVLDQCSPFTASGATVLRTTGRRLPGVTAGGALAVAGLTGPVAFVTGRVTGPPAIVTVDGWPFVATTTTANGRFVLPVRAGAALTLRYLDTGSFAERGTSSAQAPAAGGTLDVGNPLGAASPTLTVTATPDPQSLVDIGDPIVFTFSEPVDASSVSTTSIVVTDTAGRRVFGSLARGEDGSVVTFTPSRRWKFGVRYRYGVAQTVRALSGATMAQPFSGEFTTFAPRILGSVAIADARDVAVAGTLAVAATATGLTVLDVADPRRPTVLAEVSVGGGARGVALIDGAGLTDRNGQAVAGPIAVVTGGGGNLPGVLESYSLATPAAPQLLGRTQLTVPAGATPPAGVRNAPGTPARVVVDAGNRAIVAVRDMGVETVALGEAIPLDAATPGRGLGPRYPETGVEDVSDVSLTADRIVIVGAAGLTALEAVTLTRLTGVALSGESPSAAVLPQHLLDRDGDGVLETASEAFDLVVASAAPVEVLQLVRHVSEETPAPIGAVSLAEPLVALSLSAAERLAVVATAANGLALVDLDGPASFQPIDLDRDGLDDRLLGRLVLAGSPRRVGVEARGGLAIVAESARLALVQLAAPRTRVFTFLRDPLLLASGEEQSILATRQAFAGDDAVRIGLEVVAPPGETWTLSLDTEGTAAVPLSFASGLSVVTVGSGASDHVVLLPPAVSTPVRGRLSVRDVGGAVVSRLEFAIAPIELGALTPRRVFVAPRRVALSTPQPQGRVQVGSLMQDGRVFNVTRAAAGSSYRIDDPVVATVDGDGRLDAGAGGSTAVRASYRGLEADAEVVVATPAILVALRPTADALTLRAIDQEVPFPAIGVLSDGSDQPLEAIAGLSFTSDAPAVAEPVAGARLAARGAGAARVSVTDGRLLARVEVFVEPRGTVRIDTISLLSGTFALDGPAPIVGVRVAGEGVFDGVPVSLDVTPPAGPVRRFAAVLRLDGSAGIELSGLDRAGAHALTSRVVDPASGATRTASATLTMTPAAADTEPNDAEAAASPLGAGRTLTGRVGFGGDARDVFAIASAVDGTFEFTLRLAEGTTPGAVTLVVRAADGRELARVTPSGPLTQLRVEATGDVFASLEASGPVDYELALAFEQAPITLTSVTPLAGPPATVVTITGTGFSPHAIETLVSFGGVPGKVIAATRTTLQVAVPALGVDGPLAIVSGRRAATGPTFVVGNTTAPRPFAFFDRPVPRLDPVVNDVVDVSTLRAYLDATLGPAEASALAARHGGQVRGFFPSTNSYVLRFATDLTLNGLTARRRAIAAEPGVRLVVPIAQARTEAADIDVERRSGRWAGTPESRGAALQQIRLFDAIRKIRSTAPFVDAARLRPVRVAVIDTGFAPGFVEEEFDAPGRGRIVTAYRRNRDPEVPGRLELIPNAVGDPTTADHGSKVVSVIGALNNATSLSGVLNGVVSGDERPYEITSFECPGVDGKGIDPLCKEFALEFIREDGQFDVVNLSLSTNKRHEATTALAWQGLKAISEWPLYKPLLERTLYVASAANYAVRADYFLPAALEEDLDNVIGVGAVAVGDFDVTGEREDERAIFSNRPVPLILQPGEFPLQDGDVPCRAGVTLAAHRQTGSNCGPRVTLAAPGEKVFALGVSGYTTGLGVDPNNRPFNGTSASAPIVTGVAALLQAIRPDETRPLTPATLRQVLVNTADPLGTRWQPDAGVRRLNALRAVLAVLTPADRLPAYVTDTEPQSGGAGVIALDLRPEDGTRPAAPDDRPVPLQVTAGGQTVTLTRASATAVAPDGGALYVVASSPASGAGVVAIDTASLAARTFVPLSGAGFPSTGIPPSPVAVSARPDIAVSRDGRLAYVVTGLDRRLFIVNLVDRRVVEEFEDLPTPYVAGAAGAGDPLSARLRALEDRLAAVGGLGGTTIRRAELSIDGRTLLVAVGTGTGTGQQPGAVLPIDVDLYRTDPFGDPDLSDYLDFGSVRALPASGSFLGGDEPSDLAVGPDGRFAYLTHGGVNRFEAIPPDQIDFGEQYRAILGPALMATLASASGVVGLAASFHRFAVVRQDLLDQLTNDLRDLARTGRTVLSAPGVTGVFATSTTTDAASPGTLGDAGWLFPSEPFFGWNPPVDAGRLVNQFSYRDLYAKRPFAMGIRPDGRRGVLAFFQTGNYGIVDLDRQEAFASPVVGGAPDAAFHGIVAVTPALRLDNHLWPRRGAFSVPIPDGERAIPSPDEVLLYPSAVTWSAHGRYAVGAHVGTGAPEPVAFTLPSLAGRPEIVIALQELGFSVSGDSATGVVGEDACAGSSCQFVRGGGAVTILHDAKLSADLENASTPVTGPGGLARPFFTLNPLCAEREPGRTRCAQDVFTTVRTYRAGGADVRFGRPRGVAAQPDAVVLAPAFGDRVRPTTALQVHWRSGLVTGVRFLVRAVGGSTPPVEVVVRALSPLEVGSRSIARSLAQLLGAASVEPFERYRIDVETLGPLPSKTSTEVEVTR